MNSNSIVVSRINKAGVSKALKAFADVIVNGVQINGVRLVAGNKGDFISFPQKLSSKYPGKYFPICWIADANLRQEVLEAVSKAL